LSMMLNPEAGTPVQPALTPPDKKPRANTPPPS